MESVGFKEWAIVCEALGCGRQSIILRKGGIAEGRAGFSFQYPKFFLFPTWFHEQPEKVRGVDIEMPPTPADKIEIKFFAELELSRTITSWEIVQALEPLHVLQHEVVRERFEYDVGESNLHPHLSPLPNKGEERDSAYSTGNLYVGFVRVFRIAPAWTIANEKKFGGCRSWVNLPKPPNEMHLEPVLSDAEHKKRFDEFRDVIGEMPVFD